MKMTQKMMALLLAAVLCLSTVPVQAGSSIQTYADRSTLLRAAEAALDESEGADLLTANGSLSPYQWQRTLTCLLETDVQQVQRQLEHLVELMDQGSVSNDMLSLTEGEKWQSFLTLWSELEYACFTLENARSEVKHYLTLLRSEENDTASENELALRLAEALGQVDEMTDLAGQKYVGWQQELEGLSTSIIQLCPNGEALDEERLTAAEALSDTLSLTAADSNATIKVLVLDTHQTGLNVVDSEGKPIQGAILTIKAHGREDIPASSANTNENGAVAVDISAFPVNEEGFVRLDAELSYPGKRSWFVEGRYVEGGNVLVQDVVLADDDGSAYLKGVSLRGSDVLYSSDTLYITPANDIDHDLVVHLNPKGSSGTVKVHYVKDHEACTLEKAYDASTTKLCFSYPWCQDLTIGSSISVELCHDGSSTTRTLALTVTEALVQTPVSDELDTFDCTELFPGINTNIKLHDKAWLNNINFSFSFPFGALKNIAENIRLTPDGRYTAGINVSITTTGNTADWKVKSDDTAAMFDHYVMKKQSMIEKMQENKTMKTKPDSNWGKVSGGNITVGFEGILHGKATKNRESKEYSFKSNITLAVPFSFSYSYTQYMLAWAIPLHVGAEGGLNGSIGIQWQSQYKGSNIMEYLCLADFIKNASFKQVVIEFDPYLRLFAGLGVRGLCGITLQGSFNFLFRWVGQRIGDLMTFTWLGDLDLIGQFFFFTAQQSIMTGKLMDETLFDHRKSSSSLKATAVTADDGEAQNENKTQETQNQTQGSETALFAAGTGSEASNGLTENTVQPETRTKDDSPSELLQVSTTQTSISADLTGSMDSIATTNGYVYVFLNENDEYMVGWTGTDGQISAENQVKLSEISGSGEKFDPSRYYIYGARLVSSKEKVIACLLMAKHEEDVTRQLEQEDGTVQSLVSPGKTYTANLLLKLENGKLWQLDGKYAGSMPTYEGALGSPDAVLTDAQDSNNDLCVCFSSVDPEKKTVFFYRIFYNDNSFNFISRYCNNVEKLVKADGYSLQSINQVFASSADWFSYKDDCFCYYCLFTDEKDVRHILCYQPRRGIKTYLNNEKLAGMTTIWHGMDQGTFRSDVIFITEEDGQGKYNLVPYSLEMNPFDDEDFNFERQDSCGVSIPNPQVQCARTLGVNTLYWVETGSALEGDESKSQYLVRCCYVKTGGLTDVYMTKAMTLMTFDSKTFSPEQTTLSNMRMINGAWGYGGIVQLLGKDNNQVLAFELKQVIDAEIDGIMLNTPIISIGAPVTVLLNVENEGNVPLSAAELRIEDEENPDSCYEIVTIDFLHPEESSVEIHQNGAVYTLNGLSAVSEYESVSSDDTSVYMTDENGRGSLLRYKMLLPGETKSYRIVFTIPKDWGTGEKKLNCTLTAFRIQTMKDGENGQYSAAACFDLGAEILDAETLECEILVSNDATESRWFAAGGNGTNGTPEAGYESFQVTNNTLPTSVSMPEALLTLDASYHYKDGQRVIEMNMENCAAEEIRQIMLYSYADGETEPTKVLTLTPSFGLDAQYGLNFSIEESLLTGGKAVDVLTLRAEGICKDGSEIANGNDCELVLNERLILTAQPKDESILKTNTAVFCVEAEGVGPLTYEWQMSTDGGKSWKSLAGETEDECSFCPQSQMPELKAETDCRFRCVVKAGNGECKTSDAAKLILYEAPKTGDSAAPAAWLGLLLTALGLLLWLHKGKKTE